MILRRAYNIALFSKRHLTIVAWISIFPLQKDISIGKRVINKIQFLIVKAQSLLIHNIDTDIIFHFIVDTVKINWKEYFVISRVQRALYGFRIASI